MLEGLFRNTLAPWQWALLAAIPPAIVALYFLKLRRQPIEVPSTYLWKKSIEDLHVNSLWQRLRQNLLMYLQLLLVLLAILALLRPGWQGAKLDGARFIFLVDNSASMQATDVDDADNRLAAAKAQVGTLIDQMESGMTAMIISYAGSPQVVQEFTDNRRALRERLDAIRPTNGTTDLKGALELAGGLANPGRIVDESQGIEVDVVEAQPATVFIFSDGRFDDVEDFALGNLDARYVPIGSLDARNIAITAFTTRRGEIRPEERQAFVQVANLTLEPQVVVVELSLDGSFLDAREVEVPAGEAAGAVFPLADAPAGALRAKLNYELGGPDALPLDDVAFAALNELRPARVLVVSPGNPAIELALNTERATRLAEVQVATPELLTTQEYQQNAAAGEYGLIVYDQSTPETMPRANTLFIGRLPPDPAWRPAAQDEESEPPGPERTVAPQVIDWNRAHPLLSHVELGNIGIVDSFVLTPPPGGDVLIDSTAGPIFVIAPRQSFEDAVLGFEIIGRNDAGEQTVNTNWPRRHSFPTFWLNVLEYLAGRGDQALASQVRPSQPVEIRTRGNLDQITVVAPDGTRKNLTRRDQETFQYHDTQQIGVYQVLERDQVTQRFAVNLFDRQESDIAVQPSQDPAAENLAASIRIGNVDVAAMAGSTPERQEIWRLLLLAALVVLLLEWYIYNRRVYL